MCFCFNIINAQQRNIKNIVLNSNGLNLNFIDRAAFVFYCKVNIVIRENKPKCFIDIDKIVDQTIKSTPTQNNDNYNMLLTMNTDIKNIKMDFDKLQQDIKKDKDTINNSGIKVSSNFAINQNLNTITASGYFTKNKTTRFEIYDKDIFSGNLVSLKKNDFPEIGQIVKMTQIEDFLGVSSKQNNNIFEVIMSGRAEIEVSAENGAVKVGDYITLSKSFAGVGMKLTGQGQSIGIALSDDLGSGRVLMLIRPQKVE